MELLIPLDNGDERPLYEQIYQYIKQEIRCGNLTPQKKLPSSRELAKNLKVSRSTAQLAYDQLVSEGYLEARPRCGYYIAGLEEDTTPPVEWKAQRTESDGYAGGYTGEYADEYAGEYAETKEDADTDGRIRVDFSLSGIDLECFPFSTWRKISRAVLTAEEREILLKGNPMGDKELREEIRSYLYGARGVNCSADQIIVGAGSEYLLMMLSGLLGARSAIAMERLTYVQAYHVLAGMGHEIYPVSMDQSGICMEELRKLPVQAAYVMPSHQFPTGMVMPVRRRQELLTWAMEEEGRYLIEDDYDSEFRYRGKPIPALQGMDRSGKVVYMGTFSRAIAPAIRVGYLVLPEPLLKRYRKQAFRYASTVSRPDQRILAEFLSGGYFERHLNRMREVYKAKHDLLVGALRNLEPEFEIGGEFAGLHILLKSRSGRTERELKEAALGANVKVYGLSEFMVAKQDDEKEETNTILLGYAKLDNEKILSGAETLVTLYDKMKTGNEYE